MEVRVQSAPRSVRSIGMSPLAASHQDHSVQMTFSVRDKTLQIEVERRSNEMQTTMKQFNEVAMVTEHVEEELEIDID